MRKRDDSYSAFDPILASTPLTSPWSPEGEWAPDYDLLKRLLAAVIGQEQRTGRFVKSADAWAAREFRRAGFHPDEVWPRESQPRVLSRELRLVMGRAQKSLRPQLEEAVRRSKEAAPTEAKLLGALYEKQVDLVMATWARGPELLISSKSMLSSYQRNLANRNEEEYGNLKNLRGRFPLAAIGSLYVVRSTIAQEGDALARLVDMLRKLKREGFDAACLLVIDWPGPELLPEEEQEAGASGSEDLADAMGGHGEGADLHPLAAEAVSEGDWTMAPDRVSLLLESVPEDLAPPQFFTSLVERILAVTPVTVHRAPRAMKAAALQEGRGDPPGP
jgi:hypothetical protein